MPRYLPYAHYLKMEIVQDRETKAPFPSSRKISWEIHALGLQRDHSISLMPGNGGIDGTNGDHIILAPAYNIDQTDVQILVDRTVGVIRAVLG